MRFALPAGLVVLSAAALVPLLALPAAAQSAAAPHLSPVDKVLYAHHHDSDTAELNGWMNAMPLDPTANDIALGPSGQFVGGVPTAAPSRTLTLTLDPGLTGTVKLDPSGNIVISAYIGSGSSNGALRVTTAITYDGQTVAEGAAQNHVYQASTGQYGKLTWTIAPEITEFAPGKPLVWTVTMSGVAQAGFLGVSEERGKSNVEFPVLSSTVVGAPGAGPPVTRHDLNGTTVDIDLAGDGTNATHQYAWGSPGGALVLDVADASYASGAAHVRVLDAGNATLANVTFNGTAAQVVMEGVAGNWTIHVDLQSYAGNLSVTIGPKAGSGGDTGSQAGSGTKGAAGTGTSTRSTSTSSNGTGDGKKEDKGAPGPGASLVVLALAAAAVAVRRRRPM